MAFSFAFSFLCGAIGFAIGTVVWMAIADGVYRRYKEKKSRDRAQRVHAWLTTVLGQGTTVGLCTTDWSFTTDKYQFHIRLDHPTLRGNGRVRLRREYTASGAAGLYGATLGHDSDDIDLVEVKDPEPLIEQYLNPVR